MHMSIIRSNMIVCMSNIYICIQSYNCPALARALGGVGYASESGPVVLRVNTCRLRWNYTYVYTYVYISLSLYIYIYRERDILTIL